jgi:hypothetical protein
VCVIPVHSQLVLLQNICPLFHVREMLLSDIGGDLCDVSDTSVRYFQ